MTTNVDTGKNTTEAVPDMLGITVYFVGKNSEEAGNNVLFESYANAERYANSDEKIYSVTATVNLSNLQEEK